jgi:hypothetical protein
MPAHTAITVRTKYICCNTIVAVTKLHASRSEQNLTTLQHEWRSPGE